MNLGRILCRRWEQERDGGVSVYNSSPHETASSQQVGRIPLDFSRKVHGRNNKKSSPSVMGTPGPPHYLSSFFECVGVGAPADCASRPCTPSLI